MTLVIACVLSTFSTAVMSYISMATPIGPWIAPTLVLLGFLIYSCSRKASIDSPLIYVTISGSIGGILATAFGFSFPTLFFLDQTLFNSWMSSPVYFVSVVGILALAAGWYGMWIANVVEPVCIDQLDLPFPIGQMIYKMIIAQKQIRKAWELVIGFVGTMLFCFLQDGLFFIRGIIPKALTVCSSFSYYCFAMPVIRFDLWPMLWAIGFVTGHIIVVPLLVGSLSKILIIKPIHALFFDTMTIMEFVLAFCSGMVVSGVLGNFMPNKVVCFFNKYNVSQAKSLCGKLPPISRPLLCEGILLLVFISSVLFYFGFSIVSQLYLLVFTFICTYQIIIIAGKIGLAQLGRFATFVLVPALFIFNLDVIQITIISTFVEATAGVAVDVLFGRKVVQLSGVSYGRAKKYQYIGLLVSCLVIGVVFWLLIRQFGLGSPELFAQRSQARQLLIDVKEFNYMVVLVGVIFGLILKRAKMSPMLVLGGLLMPLNITLGLVVGGLVSMLAKDREQWYPFWSGIFAANSIWMLIQAIF
ncbi:MAG: OPT/YSL family transporter [Candidatus Dependentiae bacterium]